MAEQHQEPFLLAKSDNIQSLARNANIQPSNRNANISLILNTNFKPSNRMHISNYHIDALFRAASR